MSWSKEDRSGGSRGYHHGNLKEALLRAALEPIAQKGPAGFTFAEAARWAGVSPAAPYRHFRDRDELLASVALRGFERFAIVLEQAWDDGRPQPLAALDQLGRAYLEFARAERGMVRSAAFRRCALSLLKGLFDRVEVSRRQGDISGPAREVAGTSRAS